MPPNLDRLRSAISASVNSVTAVFQPDKLDQRAESVLRREAAHAELIRARASSMRTDSLLRTYIVVTLLALICFVVVATVTVAVLQAAGVILRASPLYSLLTPGGLVFALIAALVWVLRRP